MLDTREAGEIILGNVRVLGTERVALLEALGRVAAEDVSAQRQQPPWDNSAMDGFAVRAEDVAAATKEAPVRLRILEDIMAGYVPMAEVGAGQASRIMTGAPVPVGADAVVRVEDTSCEEPGWVHIRSSVSPGRDIRRAGEDQQVGDCVLEAGTPIRPAEIGVLAGAPRAWLEVYRAPTVAVIATGDELAEPDGAVAPGKIVNTSSYSISAMVQAAGARALLLPIARDDRASLERTFSQARCADAIVSIGGVSVGERDLVKDTLVELGVDMRFWKVRVTPGKPLAFGTWGSSVVFGLPGNPVSCMVSFELFVRPALRKMAGHQRLYRRMIRAVLTSDIQKRPGFKHFLRVRLEKEGERWLATSVGAQGSGVLRSMSRADGLAVGERGLSVLRAGSEVRVMPLDERLASDLVSPL